MGHLVWQLSMMTLRASFKQQHSAFDETTGPNEEEGRSMAQGQSQINLIDNQMHSL